MEPRTKLEPMPEKEDIVKPLESILGIVFTVLCHSYIQPLQEQARASIIYMTVRRRGMDDDKHIQSRKALDLYIPIWSAYNGR